MLVLLLILGSSIVAQVDESQIINLDLSREHVAYAEARAYRAGKFSISMRLNAPCTEVLADLTRANTGKYFRLNVGGKEVLFAQVHMEIPGGDIEIQSEGGRREAEALAARLRPVTRTSAINEQGVAKANCSHWKTGN